MKIGITGHQDLGAEETSRWITTKIEEAIDKYHATLGFTSLAAGADQIFAELLIKKKIPYVAVIPCENYENTFIGKKSMTNFLLLVEESIEVQRLGYRKPSETAFLEAGKQVVKASQMMIAVWNGKKAVGKGGTADIVNYAVQNNKSVIHINPVTKNVVSLTLG